MQNKKMIPIAKTHIFVNVPKHMHYRIPDELMQDVQEQVMEQYRSSFNSSKVAECGFEISGVKTRRGCLVVEITIAAVAIPSILVAIKDYKAFKESLFEIGKDVKHIWFKVRHLQVTKPACVMKIELEERATIEAAIRELEKRREDDT